MSCSLLLILIATLYPYDFSLKGVDNSLNLHLFILGWGKSGVWDVIKNILLFLPLGFGIAGCLMVTLRLTGFLSLAITFLFSLGLSYSIEVLQIFLSSRFPSFIDVLSNSTGGLLGFLSFYLWKDKVGIVYFLSGLVKENLILCLLGYIALVFLITIALHQFSRLTNWDKTYPLILGNEWTGDRPWQGYIFDFFITDRAISNKEVTKVLSEEAPFLLMENSIIGFYKFRGKGIYRDRTGNLPDLVWKGRKRMLKKGGKGLFLDKNDWLETKTAAKYLTERIIKTSQFTLGITVATGKRVQIGPARIISLSQDPLHRNFTLGQEGDDLVFRLRTPLSGENGVDPHLVVPDVFSTREPQNLVITYDGSLLLLYVNGVLNPQSLGFDPWSISLSYVFQSNNFYLVFYKIIYYAVIFLPLGILIQLIASMVRSPILKVMTICCAILLPSFVLESILVSLGKRDFGLENLLISMFFTALPAILKSVRP